MPTSANVKPKAIKGHASILSYYSASSSNEPILVNQYRLINPKANVQSSEFIFLLENSLDKVSPFENIDVNVFNKVEVRGADGLVVLRLDTGMAITTPKTRKGQVLFAKVHIVEEGTMVLCLYNVQSKRIEFELFFTKLETTLPVVVDIEALEEKDLQNFLTSLQKQTAEDMQAGIRKALDMKVAKVLKHECTKHDLANPSNRMFLLSYQDYPIECATWVSEGEAIDAASKAIRAYNRRVTLEEKKVVAAAKKATVAAAHKEAAAEIRSKKQQQKEEKEAAAAVDKAAPKRITNDAGSARPKRRKKEEKKKRKKKNPQCANQACAPKTDNSTTETGARNLQQKWQHDHQ